MGQLNVYVPDDLEEKIKEEAKREGKSVSLFVLEAVKHRIAPDTWSSEFLSLLATETASISEAKDLPLQKRKQFDDL